MSPLQGSPALRGRHLEGRSLLLLLAILLASAPMSMVLAGSSWFVLTLGAATPVIISGMVLRQLVRRQVLVPLLQLLVIAVALLAVELAQGLTSLEGGPLALLTDQAVIFPAAANELASGRAPMVLGARGTVVVMLLIALITMVLDLAFLDLGWHGPTALAIMGSILVPALQQPSGGAWWTVAGPMLGGALILVSRTVHADPTYLEGDHRPQVGPLPRPGRTVAAAALGVALIAGLAMPLGAALPQVATPRIALDIDLLNRWQNRDTPQLGPVMIDDDVSVRRSLLEQDDTEVLRYSTTATEPSYLRLRTLNTFDGETYRSDSQGEQRALGSAAFSDARDDGMAVSGSPNDFIRTEVSVQNLAGDRLPMPDNVRDVDTDDPEVTRALSVQPSNGEIGVGRVPSGLIGLNYTVLSEESTASADQLRAVDPTVFSEPFDDDYTSREEVPQIATDLAASIAEDAGAKNAFDAAVAYQDYFRDSFAYSLTVNTPPGEDPLESFLSDRIGYCEQFASTFSLMMTSQGYPTRVVIGFTAGEMDGKEWSVNSKNAHAWPEVWFGPRYGWVRFEPTPAAADNGVRPPGNTDADPGANDEQDPATEENPEESSEPSQEPTSEEPTTEDDAQETTDAAASDSGGTVGDAVTPERVEGGFVLALSLGTLVAAGGAAAVVLIRRHRVRRRDDRWNSLLIGGGGGGPGGDGPGGSGSGGGGAGGPGAADADHADHAAERERRRAGELAWSEMTGELTVRRRVIRVLGWTGAWGKPPQQIALDNTLPPARAIDDLLDQIAEGDTEVTPEHRAAAARIAAAYTAARYAAPLAEDRAGPRAPGPRAGTVDRAADAVEPSTGDSAPTGTPALQHPMRRDSDTVVELARNSR